MSEQRLYLALGDRVVHRGYPQWGRGSVVEVMTSSLPGGLCLVRILFEDGVERSFLNDLNDYNCCYYAGIRLETEGEA